MSDTSGTPTNERRDSLRVKISTVVRMRTVTHLMSGAGADVSVGGIYVVVGENFPEGTLVDMEFSIDGMDRTFDVLGEVRWKKEQPVGDSERYGLGIHFLDLTDSDQQALREFIEKRGQQDVKDTPEAIKTSSGSAATEERRDEERVPIAARVRLKTVANLTRGAGTDVSVAGIYLIASGDYTVGETVDLEFKVEGRDRVFRPTGTIKRVQSNPARGNELKGLGIEFDELSDEASDALEEFVGHRTPIRPPDHDS